MRKRKKEKGKLPKMDCIMEKRPGYELLQSLSVNLLRNTKNENLS